MASLKLYINCSKIKGIMTLCTRHVIKFEEVYFYFQYFTNKKYYNSPYHDIDFSGN